MRDGVETDVYRPLGYVGKLPAILIRTKYGKSPYRPPKPSNPVALTSRRRAMQ